MTKRNYRRLKVNKYFLPYDIYERHKKVGTYIKHRHTVLDVGGELGHLKKFCHPKKVIVANLSSGDVIISKDKLPFRKNSFDVVTSIDVLEHIPLNKRPQFIKNLFNIASELVILSFPIGTKKHVEYERETQKWLKKTGRDVVYLSEHLKFGLPSPEEVIRITKNFKKEISFSGNIFVNRILFRIFMFDPDIKIIKRVIYLAKNIFNFLTNPIFYYLLINKSYSQNVNRTYLVINKKR